MLTEQEVDLAPQNTRAHPRADTQMCFNLLFLLFFCYFFYNPAFITWLHISKLACLPASIKTSTFLEFLNCMLSFFLSCCIPVLRWICCLSTVLLSRTESKGCVKGVSFYKKKKKGRDIKLKGCENAALQRFGPITCLKVGNLTEFFSCTSYKCRIVKPHLR